jgi:hypothetical protein
VKTKLLPLMDHREVGLSDPKSNFKQLVEFQGEDAYIMNMDFLLIPLLRASELAKDRDRGLALFKELFPGDNMHIFKECVISELPRAEIVIDDAKGLYFAERIKLHPAFYMTEEGEKLLADAKIELEKFECVPSTAERVKLEAIIGKYAAPFLQINTSEFVGNKDSMEFAVKAIHTVIQKELTRIGGEQEW